MVDRHLESLIARINHDITRGLMSGRIFVGKKDDVIKNVKLSHNIDLSPTSFTEKSDSTEIAEKSINIYELENREEEGAIRGGLGLYLVGVIPKQLWTFWEKQVDLDVKENLEIGILAYKRKRKIIRHGTKAAMAAIMTRNMSHNIGSHIISYWNQVLYNLTGKYNLLPEIDMTVSGMEKNANDWVSWATASNKINGDSKQFLHYLQQRMDFIAEIVTSDPSWERTMNLRRDVIKAFKELNPLQYYIAYSENISAGLETADYYLIKERTRESQLAKYYSANAISMPIDNMKLKSDPEEFLAVLESNPAIATHIESIRKIVMAPDIFNLKINNDNVPKDLRVSIPQGTIGMHALYSILENFIRNSAKHGTITRIPVYFSDDEFKTADNVTKVCRKVHETFECASEECGVSCLNRLLDDHTLYDKLTIDKDKMKGFPKKLLKLISGTAHVRNNRIALSEEESYLVKRMNRLLLEQIYPQMPRMKTKQDLVIFVRAEDRGDYIEMCLNDNLGNCTPSFLRKKIFPYLNGDKSALVNENTGVISKGGWGIKEMKVSANFLNMKPSEDLLDNHKTILHSLCMRSTSCRPDVCEFQGNIGYKFALRKPKDLLIVKEAETDLEVNSDEMKLFYIRQISRANLFKTRGSTSFLASGGHYKFLFFDKIDDHLCSNLVTYKDYLPTRLLYDQKEVSKQYNSFVDTYFSHISLNKQSLSLIECYRVVNNRLAGGKCPKMFIRDPQNYKKWTKDNDYCVGSETIALTDDNLKLPLFDRHYELIRNNTWEKNESFYLGYEGSSSFLALLQYCPTDNIMKRYATMELLEAALTRIVIVDERVSSTIDRTKICNGVEVPVSELYEKMRIHIVRGVKENMGLAELRWKISNQNIRLSDIDFFVIHQGIIDKSIDSVELWRTYINDELPVRHRVVDSGRGRPSDLIQGAKFIQISAILKMLEEFDKFSLVQTLNALRRPLGEEER